MFGVTVVSGCALAAAREGRGRAGGVQGRAAHRSGVQGRAAHRSAERLRGVRHVGPRPPLLAAPRTRRSHRDPRPPHGVVARHRRDRAAGDTALGLGRRTAAAAAQTGTGRGRGDCDHHQLGRLHLGREHRPCGGGIPRLLHQPARHHRDGRAAPEGTAAARPVGGSRYRLRRGSRADHRVRAAAVDLPLPRLLLRDVRAGEEEGQSGWSGITGRGDRDPVPARAGVSAVAGGAGRPGVRHRGCRARGAAGRDRCGDGGAARLLRGGGDPRTAVDARAAPVPGTRAAVPARRPVLPRGHARRAVGRVRAGVGRAVTADVGRAADVTPGAADSAGGRGCRGGRGRRGRPEIQKPTSSPRP